jgi:hypothetical protein
VSITERITAKAFAPSGERNSPETFRKHGGIFRPYKIRERGTAIQLVCQEVISSGAKIVRNSVSLFTRHSFSQSCVSPLKTCKCHSACPGLFLLKCPVTEIKLISINLCIFAKIVIQTIMHRKILSEIPDHLAEELHMEIAIQSMDILMRSLRRTHER